MYLDRTKVINVCKFLYCFFFRSKPVRTLADVHEGERGEDIQRISGNCASNIRLLMLEEKKPHLSSQTSFFRLVK